MANVKYICKKAWERNQVGDVIDHYQYRRYPSEIQRGCFEIIDNSVIMKTKVNAIGNLPPKVIEEVEVELNVKDELKNVVVKELEVAKDDMLKSRVEVPVDVRARPSKGDDEVSNTKHKKSGSGGTSFKPKSL